MLKEATATLNDCVEAQRSPTRLHACMWWAATLSPEEAQQLGDLVAVVLVLNHTDLQVATKRLPESEYRVLRLSGLTQTHILTYTHTHTEERH